MKEETIDYAPPLAMFRDSRRDVEKTRRRYIAIQNSLRENTSRRKHPSRNGRKYISGRRR